MNSIIRKYWRQDSMTKVTLAIENISELITVAGENAPRMGKAQGEIEKIKDGVVLVSGDKILYAGDKKNAPKYEKSDDYRFTHSLSSRRLKGT